MLNLHREYRIFILVYVHRCVFLALYIQYFPEFCENPPQAYYSGETKEDYE